MSVSFKKKTCAIHPAALGGNDIRPQHCGFMGSIDARLGEKGYCRIIHAARASSDDANALVLAIAFERNVSERCFNEGAALIEKAGEAVIEEVKSCFLKHTGYFTPAANKESPGRNELCFCGSGKKYKSAMVSEISALFQIILNTIISKVYHKIKFESAPSLHI